MSFPNKLTVVLVMLACLIQATYSRKCTKDGDCSSLAHICAPDGHCFIPSELGMECEEDIQCTHWDPNAECLDLVFICQCRNGFQRNGTICLADDPTTLPPLLPTPLA